jgi:hypothetical protein
MLSLAVICAFCAPAALGLLVSLAQRSPLERSRSLKGFEVILITEPVVELDET